MKNTLKAVSIGTAVVFCAASANADFNGWQVERIVLGSGHFLVNIYAGFSNVGDRVVNVYNTSITTNNSGGFFQSGANPFWQPGTQNGLTSDDSWVTIDTNPNGNGNASGSVTAGDPNFFNFDDFNGATDFSMIQSTGSGAGWYNSQPATSWGFAEGNHVLVAHFVAVIATPLNSISWNVNMTTVNSGQSGSNSGVGAGANTFFWIIPAPGAIAIFGAAALAGGRRRRA